MSHPIVKRRRAERSDRIALARDYVERVSARLQVDEAWVVGSVARGDFNVWSDIDVVVVARDLPKETLPRADLFLDKPPGVQVVAYTPDEFKRELARKNPLATETTTVGVALLGEDETRDSRGADP